MLLVTLSSAFTVAWCFASRAWSTKGWQTSKTPNYGYKRNKPGIFLDSVSRESVSSLTLFKSVQSNRLFTNGYDLRNACTFWSINCALSTRQCTNRKSFTIGWHRISRVRSWPVVCTGSRLSRRYGTSWSSIGNRHSLVLRKSILTIDKSYSLKASMAS